MTKPIKSSPFYIVAFVSLVLAASAVNAAQQVVLRNDDGSFFTYNVDVRAVDEQNSANITGITSDPNWQVKAFADLNGDGNNDILMRNISGAWFAYLIADGAVIESGEIGITSNTVWEFKAAEDFNGDGTADVILRNSTSGTWFVYLLDGLSVPASGAVNLAFNQDWRFQGVADFDGDGKQDVLLRHQVNQSWFLYAMDGVGLNQSSTGLIRFALNPNWTFRAAADFTGDGKADMIMRRNDGPWWMYQADGTEVLLNENFGLLALTGSTAWQFQGVGDLNGDSRADVLLRNQNDGRWYVYALDGRSKVGGADEGVISMSTDTAWSFKGMASFVAAGNSGGGDPFVFYQEKVSGIIQEKCIACHVAGGVAGVSALIYQRSSEEGYQSTNFDLLSNYIVNESNGGETLLSKGQGVGHGGGVQFASNSEEYTTLSTFIESLGAETGNNGVLGKFWDGVAISDNAGVLRRAALIVAGRLPTDAELAAVSDNEEASLRAGLRSLMNGDGFHEFLVSGANDRLLTWGFVNNVLDLNVIGATTTQYPVIANQMYEHSIADTWLEGYSWYEKMSFGAASEPLELIAYVVEQEKPYTEILTADYTMANRHLAFVYNSDTSGFTDWNPSVFLPAKNKGQVHGDEQMVIELYSEGQRVLAHSGFLDYPHAGVLNAPTFLNRYPTTETNRNRARSRWTHYHFLGLDIEKSSSRTTDATALADTDNPTLKNQNCTVCHSTMDPVAGAFQNYTDEGMYRIHGKDRDVLPGSYKWPDIQRNTDFGIAGVLMKINPASGGIDWWVDQGDGNGIDTDNAQWAQVPGLDSEEPVGLRIEVIGKSINVFVNGSPDAGASYTLSGQQNENMPSGTIGFYSEPREDGGIAFDSLRVVDLSVEGNGDVVWEDDFAAGVSEGWLEYWQFNEPWDAKNGRFESINGGWSNAILRLPENLTDFALEVDFDRSGTTNGDSGNSSGGVWLRSVSEEGPYAQGDFWFRDMLQPGFIDQKMDLTESATSLQWLAGGIVSDDRFATAALKFWWPALMGVDLLSAPGSSDDANYQSLLRAFEEQQASITEFANNFRAGSAGNGAYNAKDLFVDMMMSPWFSAQGLESAIGSNREAELADLGAGRLLTPEELERKTLATTGVAWERNENIDWDSDGYYSSLKDRFRLDYGGIDSAGIKTRSRELNAIMSNVAESQALQISAYAVLADFARPDNQRFMFSGLEPDITPLSEMSQIVEVAEVSGDVGAYFLKGHLNAGEKILRVDFLNDWADELSNRDLIIDMILVRDASGAEIKRFDFNDIGAISGIDYQSCDSNQPDAGLYCEGYLSVPWTAETAGTYQFVFRLKPEQAGPDNIQAVVSVATDNVNSSAGATAIRANLQSLHRSFLGEDLALDSEELTASYNLLVDIWTDRKNNGEHERLQSPESNYKAANSWWEEDHTVEHYDPTQMKTTWASMLIYLMTDYKYLHE